MISTPSKTILASLLATIAPADKTTLAAESTNDIARGIVDLIKDQRGQTMTVAVAALITGSCANWNQLDALEDKADNAVLLDAIAAFDAAKKAKDGNALCAAAVGIALATKKHFGLPK